MGKTAFVFSGQGAQYPGMGLKLYESSAAAAKVFEAADKVRPDISKICFSGSEDDLKITANTQPCLYTVEMAAAAAVTEAGIKADMAAGFSLGELAALTYADAMDLDTGLALVNKRARFMQEAADQADTAMGAVCKLPDEQVEEICSRFTEVYPVNYNCPGQVTVAMLRDRMEPLSAAVKEAGGRLIPIKVSGAFHSPYMVSASENFGRELSKAEFRTPEIPVYSNLLGDVYTDDIAYLLEKQICSPVRWETIVRKMIAGGADTFIELGAGKTLSGFIKKTDPDVRTFTAESPEEIEKIVSEIER